MNKDDWKKREQRLLERDMYVAATSYMGCELYMCVVRAR